MHKSLRRPLINHQPWIFPQARRRPVLSSSPYFELNSQWFVTIKVIMHQQSLYQEGTINHNLQAHRKSEENGSTANTRNSHRHLITSTISSSIHLYHALTAHKSKHLEFITILATPPVKKKKKKKLPSNKKKKTCGNSSQIK